MMQTHKLVARPGARVFGLGMGLALADSRTFLTPSDDGANLAHDLLEHQNGTRAIGTTHDELVALGAFWFVRGQFRQFNSGDQHSAAKILQGWSDAVRTQVEVTLASGMRARPAKWRDVVGDERELPGEFETPLQAVCEHTAKSSACFGPILRARMPDILHYLRLGARLASERYASADAANKMFWDITTATKDACVSAAPGHEYWLSFDDKSVNLRRLDSTLPKPYIHVHDEFTYTGTSVTVDETKAGMTATEVNMIQSQKRVNVHNIPRAKVHGPQHAQRNVYKEARYAKS